MREGRWLLSWVLALFVAVMFVWIADLTLFPPNTARNVVFPLLADYSGIAYFEPTGRLATGAAEALAALLLILPWTRRLGAILAVLVAVGAVAAHVLWLGIALPVEIGSTQTDGGQLFYLALALLAASVLLVFIHPGKAEAR